MALLGERGYFCYHGDLEPTHLPFTNRAARSYHASLRPALQGFTPLPAEIRNIVVQCLVPEHIITGVCPEPHRANPNRQSCRFCDARLP